MSGTFVTGSHVISHIGRRLLHGSLRVIKPQPRFKVCNISYMRVLFEFLAVAYILRGGFKPGKPTMV
jgi:hypothetical protein